MFLSCCTTDFRLGDNRVQKHLDEISPKTPPTDFDVVDNPNTWKKQTFESNSLFDTMQLKKNRWDSFDRKWPLNFIDINELVDSGFFYLQSDDKVQCAFCKLILCSWKAGDRPIKEHIKASPKCPFLMKAGNESPKTIASNLQQRLPYSAQPTLSHVNPNKPKNPRMIDVKMRLSTFRNWPHAAIKIQDLADCGLYYTGIQDVVTCFYCGGSLSSWDPTDVPIVEHAKFYPKCNYLRIIQSRPVYQRLKSVGPFDAIVMQAAENFPSQVQGKDVLNSDIVVKAKEIFPPSLVEKVVVQHLEKGEIFKSLHHLCEKVLQQEDKERRFKTTLPKMNSEAAFVPQSISTTSIKSDALLCKICMDSEREVVFQPCGHLIACEKCAAKVDKCPMCRKNIDGRMRTFLS